MDGMKIAEFSKLKAVEDAAAAEPVYDYIDYMGEKIRIRPYINPMAIMRMSALMDRSQIRTPYQVINAISSVLRDGILEEDWPKFEDLTEEYEVEIDVLKEVAEYIAILYVRRPLANSSASSDGQTSEPTGDESNNNSSEPSVDSESPDSVSLEPKPEESSNN